MTPNNFSNISVVTTLVAGIGAGDLSMTVADATGYPAVPFQIVLDLGSATSEEAVLVTVKAGVVWTITRAYDGTTAKAHSSGASVIHTALARDFRGLVLGTRDMSTAAPVDGQAVVWDDGAATWEPGSVSVTPGGADTQVQFNNANAFDGAPALTYSTALNQTVLQGQANHTPSLGAELLTNTDLATDMAGWSGTGWSWVEFSPGRGSMVHDPGYTDLLVYDTPLINTDEVALVTFGVSVSAGAVEVGFTDGGPPAFALGKTLVTQSGDYTVALVSPTDNVQLVANPQPSGFAVFDGSIIAPLSVKLLSFSDAILISKLLDTSFASLQAHIGEVTSAFLGQQAGSGTGPEAFNNLAIGPTALQAGYLATGNIALGSGALQYGSEAISNVALGFKALQGGHEAQISVAIGQRALQYAYGSRDNVAIGGNALQGLSSGDENTAIGRAAGADLVRGTGNVLIGHSAGADSDDLTDASYQLRISHYIAPVPLIAGNFQDQTLTIGGDLDFTANDEGPILIDRTTATRYRLYVDSGVLSIEAV